MSFLDRIKSVVRGNPVTREYEIGRHVASAGPGLMWKVHSGVKKSTKQKVSVFIFSKNAPDFEKLPKRQREAILDMLRKGPTHLVKLRHPRLLTIEHPVEDSSDSLAFVTEPVFASLANVLGRYDNVPTPLPLAIKEYEMYPVETQYGLLQMAEALHFLHSDVKMMHGNLIPEAVVINSNGLWKLMGFNFCCYSHYQSEAQTSFEFREWDSRRPILTNPSLDFLAPEYILSRTCGEASDIFSFGMLCYVVYNQGKPLYESHNNMLTFKQNIELISRVTETALGQVPMEFKELVRSCLVIAPSVRPDALLITKHPFFEEVVVSTLKYLDRLYERGDMEKSQFFKKNLARVITMLPKRIVLQRVLPALTGEFRNHKMIPFVLPLILLVSEDCNMQEFASLVLPVLMPALKVQDPIQVPLIFLQKMDLLLKKTSPEEVKKHILPMIIRSMEADHSQLQELCVSIIPTFANMVDYSSMKHSIVPRITALCISTKSLSLQVKCLVAMGQMLDILDKHIVLDHILPILEQVPSREPGVLMAILGIYHQTMVNKKLGLDKLMLATRILPFLVPLSVEPTLNVQQFNQFMKVIGEMLKKVEVDQKAHLEQLSKMEEQTRSTVEFAREVSDVKAMEDSIHRLEDMFGSSGSHEAMGTHRVGSLPGTGKGATMAATTTAGVKAETDLLGGLSAQPVHLPVSAKPAPQTSPSSYQPPAPPPRTAPSSYQPPSAGKPNTQTSKPEAMKPIVIPPQHSSSTALPFGQSPMQPQPAKPPSMGYTPPPMGPTGYTPPPIGPTGYTPPPMGSKGYPPPPLQPQAQKPHLSTSTSAMGAGDLDFLSSLGTGSKNTPSSHTGTSSRWSSSMLTPTSSTGLTGQAGMQPTGGSSGGNLFSGMHTYPQSTPLQPASTGMYAGMQYSQTQPGSFSQEGGGGAVLGYQGSLSQPLAPTQTKENGGAGWSTGIQGGGGGVGGLGQHQMGLQSQNPMSWSPSVARSSQGGGGMGAGGGSGIGSSSAIGTGWSSNIASQGGIGGGTSGSYNKQAAGSQGQLTAASLMMGGGPMLAPTASGNVPQSSPMLSPNTAYYPQQPQQQHSSVQPAAGDNPFADLSFLS